MLGLPAFTQEYVGVTGWCPHHLLRPAVPGKRANRHAGIRPPADQPRRRAGRPHR